jgi:hypothetical protein
VWLVANNDAATVLQGSSATADEQAKSSLRLSLRLKNIESKVCSFPFEIVRWHTDKIPLSNNNGWLRLATLPIVKYLLSFIYVTPVE